MIIDFSIKKKEFLLSWVLTMYFTLCRLLIWEECYYEPTLSAVPPCIAGVENRELPFGEWEGDWGSETSSQLGSQPWDKVHLLINKMMNNRINIVGQGYAFVHSPIFNFPINIIFSNSFPCFTQIC